MSLHIKLDDGVKIRALPFENLEMESGGKLKPYNLSGVATYNTENTLWQLNKDQSVSTIGGYFVTATIDEVFRRAAHALETGELVVDLTDISGDEALRKKIRDLEPYPDFGRWPTDGRPGMK